MSKDFEIIIATPEREVYRERVTSVSLPTVDGEITVLANHVPITTILKPGELVIRKEADVSPYAVSGGFIEVQPGKMVILADTAEHVTEIDEQRAEEAIARAQALKTQQAADTTEYATMVAKLERDLNRIRIVRKHRSHRSHTPGITHQTSGPR